MLELLGASLFLSADPCKCLSVPGPEWNQSPNVYHQYAYLKVVELETQIKLVKKNSKLQSQTGTN